ncbi:MAG: LacI family DNA-binding transcriptional regulator [Chloroflexi bacterium]|nr:LacI family DNA-binding transcriptional regulator [Chloroflexota bacterium]
MAARAGVSRTTVSLVLNDRGESIPDATRQRVLDAARDLDYHPHHSARGLAGGRSHTLALVLRQTAEQVAGDALLAETLRGLAGAARSAHYRVLVEPLTPGDATYGDLVRSQRADGAVVSGPLFDDPELSDLVDDGFPIVIQGSLPGTTAPSVDIDNVAGARTAVEHLIRLGHRRIACITNAPMTYTAAADRVAGYRAALAAAGLEADPALLEEGGYDASSGHRAMAAILARGVPEAIFVASDVVALGAIGALREAGLRVPEDVSVVGFDDIPLAAYFDPPLTTIHLPATELGLAAGRALLDLIGGRDVPRRSLLATEIVIRSSTAPRGAERGNPTG